MAVLPPEYTNFHSRIMTSKNTRVILAKQPVDDATADCFSVETLEDEALEPGQVRVAVEYISVDAGTRTMLRGEGFHAQNLGHG